MTKNQEKLKKYMNDLSEEAYCAGWVDGLEYVLWTAIVSGPREYGRLNITNSHINSLRSLSDECGGWIYFDDASRETFIPIDAWKAKYIENINKYRNRIK
jgi:hypothetical protein